MPIPNDTSLDSKTLGAFRASGETDLGKFLAAQGAAKDTPPGVSSFSGGMSNFQGATAAERAAVSPAPAAANSVLASGGSIQAARAAYQKATKAPTTSLLDRLTQNLKQFSQSILGNDAALRQDAQSLNPKTVMEAKAYGAAPQPVVVAPASSGSISDRWSQ